MAYESITIGTEQELSNAYVALRHVPGFRVKLDWASKTIVSIYAGEEKLVDVTVDTRVACDKNYDTFQLELRTTKAKGSDKEAWNRRKEAIKLFADEIMQAQGREVYRVSGFVKEWPGIHGAYVCRGKDDDNREFCFMHSEGISSARFSNQLTVGIDEGDLLNEFVGNTLSDQKIWDMLWMKDCTEELNGALGAGDFTAEQKFLYSYICSVFDYSVNVYIRIHPEHDQFMCENRNSSKEKNMWHVLPRTMVSHLLKRLEKDYGNIYRVFRNRIYCNGAEPGKVKENNVYKDMAGKFWVQYDANEFLNADLLLRAGIIDSEEKHYLFEFRSVLNSIENVYGNSGAFIYRPIQQAEGQEQN